MKNRAGGVILAGVWALLAMALLAPMGCRSPDEAEVQGAEVPNGPGSQEPGKEPVKPAKLYAISVTQPDNGAIQCSRAAAAGAAVTLTLTPQDEYHRYSEGSLAIEPEVELADMGGGVWRFTMPDGPVSITAEFEEIPAHTVTLAGGVENGSFSISGVEMTGPYAGEAREGAPITITVIPDAGYKLADNGLCVTPAGAVAFARVEGQLAWTFDMPNTDLEIGVAFAELGPLEIYKGGARRGISVGELSDDKKYYANSINMESEDPGHNGNQRAIKITHAVGPNGGNAQQSFGLFSDTEIDLDTVAALSFWAKASRTLNIRYVGFGDADPDRRVVYTGENYNQQISIGVEWKRYVIPVPASRSGQRTARAFFFNAQLTAGNYVYVDDIEFIESGITLTEIVIPDIYNTLFYGPTDVEKMLKGIPVKMVFSCDDMVITTLQNASNSHTLKYNLAPIPWLLPFIAVSGNVTFSNGVIIPRRGADSAITLSVNIPGARSAPMTAHIIDGLLLDDFEGAWSGAIPANPAEKSGYIWHNNASGSVTAKDYITAANNEVYGGLSAGFWRPAKDAKDPRGGRNFFEAKDATGYNTLCFRIRVTAGTAASSNFQKNTVFTFELKNGGERTVKTSGSFFTRQFTYDTDNDDGWQEVAMPLADFAALGLDLAAITGYAFGVADNQGVALRIMLDDIALLP